MGDSLASQELLDVEPLLPFAACWRAGQAGHWVLGSRLRVGRFDARAPRAEHVWVGDDQQVLVLVLVVEVPLDSPGLWVENVEMVWMVGRCGHRQVA